MIVLRRSTLAPIALVALMAAAGCGRKEAPVASPPAAAPAAPVDLAADPASAAANAVAAARAEDCRRRA